MGVLTLIGSWSLSKADLTVRLSGRKPRDLFTYLALSPARQSRAALAALFWPGSASELARSSLRQSVSVLNRALVEAGLDILDTSAESLGLRAAGIVTDVDLLGNRLAAGEFTAFDCDRVEALPKVLLTGFGETGPALEDWARDTRARLIGGIQAQLVRALTDTRAKPEMRLRLARAALVLDAYDEAAARAVMSCLVEGGNAAAALRFYGEFFDRLGAELDAEPSVETQDLAVRIKQMEPGAPVAAARGPAPDAPAPRVAPALRAGAVVAVLPFDIYGSDPAERHVSLGLLDQITCHLSTFRAPAVISSNSTRGYLGRAPAIAEVREALRADYVVTGTVLTRGAEARVTVQLVDAPSGVILWAQGFPARTEALFDIHATIAERIAHAIAPSVDLAELRRVEGDQVAHLEPYHLVLRAKDLILRLERAAFDQAGDLLAEAERKDPGFGPLHALRAEWLALRLWQGWSESPERDVRTLEAHALRAVAALPGNGRCIALLAHCRTLFDRAHGDALRLFDRALEICPNDSETLAWTVPTLAYCDRAGQAIAHGTKAIALSPLDPFLFRNEHFLSIAHYAAGEMDRAAELGLSVLNRAPDYGSNLRMTIAALQAAGRRPEARDLAARHRAAQPGFAVSGLLPKLGFQSAAMREIFAGHLVAAGLPA